MRREHYGERKWDSLKGLQAERSKLTADQDRLYAERERIKKQIKEVETVNGNVYRILKTENRKLETPSQILCKPPK